MGKKTQGHAKGQAPSNKLAQKRNWVWCRVTNCKFTLLSLGKNTENLLLPSEAEVLANAGKILEKFISENDNGVNWEKRKLLTARLAEAKEQAEEY
jgi:hypothetical protein